MPRRPPSPPPHPIRTPSRAPATASWGVVAAIFGCTLLAYWPAVHAAFIWNDSDYVTAPPLRSLHGLWRIWFEVGATQQYYPLLHSAFWVQHQLWGDAPAGYHLVNIFLHATAACLFAVVLQRLAVPGAWLAGVVFALHPVCVESVAWVTEQKNTLSLVFYLLAALVYLRFDVHRKASHYALALALFGCALLSKTTTATLPPALLVAFWWQRGRIDGRRDVVPLLPWFAAAATMGLFSAWVERTYIGADGANFALSFLQRGLLAGRIIWFYVGKFFWPADLIFIYPRWDVAPALAWHWLFSLGVLAVLGAAWAWRGRSRAPLATALLFAGSLFPVLGFFNVFGFTYSFVADHWQYLPCLALVAPAAAGLTRLLARHAKPVRATAVGLLVVMLGLLSWRQSRMYNDIETFYRTTIAQNPDCWMAYNNLGRQLANDRTRLPEAISLFEQSLALHPTNTEALSNLGLALTQTDQPAAAITRLNEAVRLNPKFFQAYNNLGFALSRTGRLEESAAAFARAAQLNPTVPQIFDNWGKICQALGRAAEAEQHFAEAARLRREADSAR
jgi:tetratricopeptide (TPR) repeat protein